MFTACELPETLTADSCLLKSFQFKKMNKKVNSHEIVFLMNSRPLIEFSQKGGASSKFYSSMKIIDISRTP